MQRDRFVHFVVKNIVQVHVFCIFHHIKKPFLKVCILDDLIFPLNFQKLDLLLQLEKYQSLPRNSSTHSVF